MTALLAALDSAGVIIATRSATPARPITHALTVKAETESRVRRRHEARLTKDRALLGALQSALQGQPSLRRTGLPAQRLMTIQLPTGLREVVKPATGSADSPANLIAAHHKAIWEALDATSARITESISVLAQLDAGEYELAPASILSWVSSRQRGQRALRAASLTEPYELLGLHLAPVVTQVAA